MDKFKYVFGPVPSRRLGYSLGINNLPSKICSYSCIYCQLGATKALTIRRYGYSDPDRIVDEILTVLKKDVNVDYITFVPNGEPTLDLNLGKIVETLREETAKPLAILTNASLIWMSDVFDDLLKFDLVSIKIDATMDLWRQVNRPHPDLEYDRVLEGIMNFSETYDREIITETMLIHHINTSRGTLENIATVIQDIKPKKAYLSIPIRPPTENWVKKPTEEELVLAYAVFSRKIGEDRVEILGHLEPFDFQVRDDPIGYILATTRVHPLSIEYAKKILSKCGLDPEKVLQKLFDKQLIKIVEFEDKKFILARIH